MIAFIAKIFGGRLLSRLSINHVIMGLAAAAIVIAMGWTVKELRAGAAAEAEVARLNTELTRAAQELADAEEAAREQRERHARALMSVADEFFKERERLLNSQDLLEGINEAPAEDDAPVAPVLRNLLEQLP